MTGDVFIDTNVFVYAYDPRARSKQEKALALLRRLVVNGRGRISTQVLGEFYVVTTSKLEHPLSPAEAAEQVVALAAAWPVLPVTPFVVLEAARGASGYQLHYWDAQLWATARLNQIPLVLSEDFAHERGLDGVQFLNPFLPAFDPAALG